MPSSRYPLDVLRQVLSRQTPTRGVVTRISGTEAQIATSSGLVSARISGRVSVGQAVSITGGVCRRRVLVSDEYPL